MRVTHVITRLVIGGAQENTVATVLGLQGRPGLTVQLISGPTTGPEGSLENSFQSCPELLTVVPNLVRPVHPWKDALALRHLIRLFQAQRPDLVHTHSGKAGILGRLAARRAQVPLIIHHIHGPSFGPFQGPLANCVFTMAERYAAKTTTHFICSAEAMASRYLAAGIGHPGMYTRVFSGFPVEPFLRATNDPQLRNQLGFPEDAFIIGKIGRLAPLKGHADLMQAVTNLLTDCPQAHLLFLGDGPLRADLEAKARANGLAQRIKFAGLVPPADVPRYVGVMDCVAHLSAREALSRALPQALAAGKPIIAYDFDGADEVCLEDQTGYLVRTGDADTVTNRLLRLAKDATLRERLGRQGQALVRDQFDLNHMLSQLYDLYERLGRGIGLASPMSTNLLPSA